jgi:hypothetical protein
MNRPTLTLHVEGIGWHSPGVADWVAASALLQAGTDLPLTGDNKPAASVLSPNEARRAPHAVLVACDVAGQACTMAQRTAADLPCIFASMHGDLAITEHMCLTLAEQPLELSPTKFHNSVLNAPVGYWTVATQCHAASNAVSASGGSFAAGLFEAALEAHAEDRAVLLAVYDTAAQGPLAEAMQANTTCGAALVLSPQRSAHSRATLRIRHDGDAHAAARPVCGVAMASALPLFVALAHGTPTSVRLPHGNGTELVVEVSA